MSLTPECLAQLGLQIEPFGLVPEDSALYRDALLDGFGDLALRALAEPSAVLLLAGAGGVGRSTQLQQVLSRLADNGDLIAFRARPKVGFEAIDATIRFHLSQLGSEDPSASLLHLFGERLRAGRMVLLAIDDAHLLGAPVLEHLFALRRQLLERVGTAAHFFLVGDPAFAANPLPGLDAEADAQVLRLLLRAFNREQTHGYLRHRLLSAGHGQPDALLKRELVDRLHRSSSGLPKYLNALAEDWLEEYCDQHANFADAGDTALSGQTPGARAVGGNSAAGEAPADEMVSTMTALEALRNASSQELERPNQGVSRAGAKASVGSRSDHAQPALTKEPPCAGTGHGQSGEYSQQPAERQKKRPKVRKKAQATATGNVLPVWNRPWFVPGIAMFSLVALLLPLVWQLPDSEDEGVSTRARPGDLLVAQPPQRAPVAPGVPLEGTQRPDSAAGPPVRREFDVPLIIPGEPTAPATSDTYGIGSESADAVPAGNQPTTAEGQREVGVTDASADQRGTAENAGNGLESPYDALDRDWILRQSGQHFTIQLAATGSASAARQHVASFGNVDARLVPTRTKSQNFVVVLAGVYPAREDAERALEQLPAALREQGYWIRSIDSVRQSLRE